MPYNEAEISDMINVSVSLSESRVVSGMYIKLYVRACIHPFERAVTNNSKLCKMTLVFHLKPEQVYRQSCHHKIRDILSNKPKHKCHHEYIQSNINSAVGSYSI